MQINGDVLMGYSMRTARYRLTEWVKFDMMTCKPFPEFDPFAVEVYDHETDPDENVNVADCPDYKNARKELHETLAKGWRGALPKI
jgi:iduronate 2-sulfatase